MVIVNAKIGDMVRVEMTGRAHSFSAALAVAWIEIMQYAVEQEEWLGLRDVEPLNGVPQWEIFVGTEGVRGATVQDCVLSFWEQYARFGR